MQRRGNNVTYHVPHIANKKEYLEKKEKKFILDGVAMYNISSSYSCVNPKLGSVIPPYNSQKDGFCKSYFSAKHVRNLLIKYDQQEINEPIEGITQENFFKRGAGKKYLGYRNKHGCGRSIEEYKGHTIPIDTTKEPVLGYNGELGYRRNEPHLRHKISVFDNHNPNMELIIKKVSKANKV